MRTAPLLALLLAFPAVAQDDYYQRQLEQRQYDARMESQRLESQRLESQRLENERLRRAQDRIDQENSDARWEAQQQQRNQATQQQIALQRRIAADTIASSQRLGLQRARAERTSECTPLQLPGPQTFDEQLTGYFSPEATKPYFMATIELGPDGDAGRLSFIAHLREGELPTVARSPVVELDLWLHSQRGPARHFRARSGTIEFSRAVQSVSKGTFAVEVKDLLLREVAPNGYSDLQGGACLSSNQFTLSANWHRK